MKHKTDFLSLVIIFVFSLLMWFPGKGWPAFWDGLGYVIPSAYEILDHGFAGLSSKFTDFAHPPLIPLLVAMGIKMTPASNLGWHLALFGFIPMLIGSVYLLIRRFYSPQLSLIGAIAIGLTPIIVVEATNAYLDLPAAALMLLSVALLAWNKPKASIFVLTLMMLTKFTLLPVVIIHWFWLSKQNRKLLVLPLITLVTWLLLHKAQMGWLLTRPGRPMLVLTDLNSLGMRVGFVIKAYLSNSLFHVVAVVGFVSWFISTELKINLDKYLKAFAITVVFSMLEFVLIGEMAARYAMGFTVVLTILGLVMLKNKPNLYLISVMLIGIINIYGLFKTQEAQAAYEFSAPDDGRYFSMLSAFRELGAFASIQMETANWYTGFPDNLIMEDPKYGFVARQIKPKLCTEFKFDPATTQYIVVHPYSPSSLTCRQLLDKVEVKLYRKIERQDAWIDIYEVLKTDTGSKK